MTAHYSYQWADEVTQSLEEKYTRATIIVMKILCVSHRNLVALLANNDPAFPFIRDLIHSVNRILQMPGKHPTDVEWQVIVRRIVIKRHNERFQKRLDELGLRSSL